MINIKSGFLYTVSCIGILFSCTSAKHIVVEPDTHVIPEKTDSLYKEIQRLGLEYTQKSNVPGVAVAVIENGKVTWIQCIGYADVVNKKPVTNQTIFNVGSVSKVVAAWGFMQLTEKKLVELDDPVINT
ncbi:serine hydrolase domain-containing protein [Chryseobacterium sp. DT-3]|uniref:serine hydrolase domain-containing protein n=1 Tax=Chryseobacterium sp. DT-3 TaxID=3396164 RepID=UPI003F1D5CF5